MLPRRFVRSALGALGALVLASSLASSSAHAASPAWGLMAPSQTPMKAVYFFVGPPPASTTSALTSLWTQLPSDPAYLNWETSDAYRNTIVGQIAAANANVIVMSYWGYWTTQEGPMKPTWPKSYDELFAAVSRMSGQPLRIMPAVEGIDVDAPHCVRYPAYDYPGSVAVPSPFLYDAVDTLVTEYLVNPAHPEWARSWLQMIDRNGTPRYAINLLHMASIYGDAAGFANGLDWIASKILINHPGINVGFTIDPFDSQCGGYNPTPETSQLGAVSSFLGIQAFDPEITIGGVDPQDPPAFNGCPYGPALGFTCTDNNTNGNLGTLEWWKRHAFVNDWVVTGNVPVILDVSPGYDGHIIFPSSKLTSTNPSHVGIYGDNATDRISDSWRNHESEMKRGLYANGRSITGMVYNAWNGFAESLTAVPSQFVIEPGITSTTVYSTQLDWLTHQYGVDVRYCDHMHYTKGAISGHVYGAICALWECFGAEDGYGAPLGYPRSTKGKGGQANDFVNGGTIYWNASSGVTHEVHGAINALYQSMYEDFSYLGLPVSDELPNGAGRINYFEHGWITWDATNGARAFYYPYPLANVASTCSQ